MKAVDDDGGKLVGKADSFNDEPSWLTVAKGELGVKEAPGKAIEKRVVEYHLSTTLGATDDAVPWCASFVCWCLEQAGYKSTKSARAISYGGFGKKLEEPKPGAIIVTKRKGGHHVGFFVGKTQFGVKLLGGNQSDMVCVKEFPDSMVIAVRYPDPLKDGDK